MCRFHYVCVLSSSLSSVQRLSSIHHQSIVLLLAVILLGFAFPLPCFLVHRFRSSAWLLMWPPWVPWQSKPLVPVPVRPKLQKK
jgi:hypothetical protein